MIWGWEFLFHSQSWGQSCSLMNPSSQLAVSPSPNHQHQEHLPQACLSSFPSCAPPSRTTSITCTMTTSPCCSCSSLSHLMLNHLLHLFNLLLIIDDILLQNPKSGAASLSTSFIPPFQFCQASKSKFSTAVMCCVCPKVSLFWFFLFPFSNTCFLNLLFSRSISFICT